MDKKTDKVKLEIPVENTVMESFIVNIKYY